jgi:hypothetical protein
MRCGSCVLVSQAQWLLSDHELCGSPVGQCAVHVRRRRLAVRAPNVWEPVGGRPDDWDPYLKDRVDLTAHLGVICEVKTGEFDEAALFRGQNVAYAVGRLGLVGADDIGATGADARTRSPVKGILGYATG